MTFLNHPVDVPQTIQNKSHGTVRSSRYHQILAHQRTIRTRAVAPSQSSNTTDHYNVTRGIFCRRSDLETHQFQLTMFGPHISARARYRSSGVLLLVRASGGGDYWGEYGESMVLSLFYTFVRYP